jgi:hypothetical protein
VSTINAIIDGFDSAHSEIMPDVNPNNSQINLKWVLGDVDDFYLIFLGNQYKEDCFSTKTYVLTN